MELTRSSLLAAALLSTAIAGCAPTDHPVKPMLLGTPQRSSVLEAVVDQPGPLTVESVVGAEWHVQRSGLINLEHPKAKAAGLADGAEPILLLFHAIHHPTRGTFMVDTGAERALRDDPDHAAISGLVARLADVKDMRVRTATADWLSKQAQPVRGVLLTHLHLDHIAGMRDLPASTPIWLGPGDAESHGFMNLLTNAVFDRALAGKGALQEFHFQADPDGEFDGVLDVFGDQSLWAIWVPGHTPGSVAFVARTANGPILLTGDACHTRWGWQNGVEPGSFSEDQARSARSLARLEKFATRHPGLDVRLGHQSLASPATASNASK